MENMKPNFLFYWNIGYTKFITNEGTERQWVIEQFKNALKFVIPIIIPAKYHFVLHSPIQREVSNSVFYTFKVYRNDAYWTRVKKFTSAVWDAREHEWWINQRIDHCSRGQTTLLSWWIFDGIVSNKPAYVSLQKEKK